MTAASLAKPPSLFWTLTEGRAVVELGSFALLKKAMRTLPKGDGHPVLVLPGFMASDRSTRPLRGLLDDLGYETFGWGLGQNVRFNEDREREMLGMFESIVERTGQSVSIVGWSLGGVFAREIAKLYPEQVRLVISLGSPISNDRNHSNARRLFEAINGAEPASKAQGRYDRLDEAPPVPTTSILTKTDGVVAWRGSVQRPMHGVETENIVVPASHFGLGVNPLVMVAIADRLAQDEGAWTPFSREGWRRVFFTEPPLD